MTPPSSANASAAKARAPDATVPDPLMPDVTALQDELLRLRRRAAREREIRLQAEAIAEAGLSRLYRQQRELVFQQQIATLANQSVSVEEALRTALALIGGVSGHAMAHAWRVTEDGSQRSLVAAGTWQADTAPAQETPCRSRAVALAPVEGLARRVLATGMPAWISDLAAAAPCRGRDEALARGLACGFAIPLLVGDEVLAVIEVFGRVPAPSDEALLALMRQAGTQLGRVIERERANDRMHDALNDALTGLPNRAHFLNRLEAALRRAPAMGFAVLFIDLDQFKVVNDSLGHAAGDALVAEVGQRLRSLLAEADGRPDIRTNANRQVDARPLLARLGGDEFTVLLRGVAVPDEALAVAERLQVALRQPFLIDGREVTTSASIGVALYAPRHRSAFDVLRDADLAMYHAKAAGKARSALFDEAMHKAASARLALESDLRIALRDESFVLHYQPIVSLVTDEVVGFEALVRWRLPDGSLRYPGDFIGVAEETGLVLPLGVWVLTEACRALRRWDDASPHGPRLSMSVNLAARQFAQPELAAQVATILRQTGIDPSRLRLEITETTAMIETEHAMAALQALRDIGVQLSLDDFGTGFSCLGYLHRIPIQVLKIDRSFVARMSDSDDGVHLVMMILGLARALGKAVVAEGAETEEQMDLLRALGCQFCQGYFISRPIPEQQIGRFIVDWRSRNAAGMALPA